MHIFTFDERLRDLTLPYVNLELELVNWSAIFEQSLGPGYLAAVAWAHCLWRDKAAEIDPFQSAFAMDAALRRRVLQAVAIRWCLPIDHLRALRSA